MYLPAAFTRLKGLALWLIGVVVVMVLVPAQAMPAEGDPDTSFDSDGFAVTDFAGGIDYIYEIAIQDDGKIVVGGVVNVGLNNDFGIARYNSDGSLDTSFSSDGRVTKDWSGGTSDEIYGLALQDDGGIVVVGYTNNGLNHDIVVARYRSNGSLDTSFSSDGKVITDLGGGEEGHCVAIQEDGKIVVAVEADNGADTDFVVVRYNSDGSLDTSFDSDGYAWTDLAGDDDTPWYVAIQDDGKIVVAGHADNGANEYTAVVRYNCDGSLDTSFSSDGIAMTNRTGGDEIIYNMAIQDDGKIVVAGYGSNGSDADVLLARFNGNGSLDTSFDTDGYVLTDLSGGDDDVDGLAFQADGKIVVAGEAHNGLDYDFAVVRYLSDGSLDTSFGSNGYQITDLSGGGDSFYAMAIQEDGKIVAAGETEPGTWDFAVGRYIGDETAPEVVSTTPADQATGQGVDITVRAEFNEGIDESTLDGDSFFLSGGVTGTVTYDEDTHIATFTPDEYLEDSTTYTVTLTVEIKDLAGNRLAAEYTWTFTTGKAGSGGLSVHGCTLGRGTDAWAWLLLLLPLVVVLAGRGCRRAE